MLEETHTQKKKENTKKFKPWPHRYSDIIPVPVFIDEITLFFHEQVNESVYMRWNFWDMNMWDIQNEDKILGNQQHTVVELKAIFIFAGYNT